MSTAPARLVQASEERRPALVAAGLGLLVANLGIGVAVAGRPAVGLLLAALPLLGAAAMWLAVAGRRFLVVAPFVLALFLGHFADRFPGTSGVSIYPADLVVGLALAGWLLSRLLAPERTPPWPRTAVLSWPFVLLALAILIGVVRGHAKYGAHYLSEPTRLLLYAAFAGAVASVTAHEAYRSIVVVFYAGAVWQAILAVYHLGTGTSATLSSTLSTGGTRTVALSTTMYLAAALALALLNLDADREGPRLWLHLAIAGLATFGIVISLGRTIFIAVGLIVPVLLFALRIARRRLILLLPVIIPVGALLFAAMVLLKPSLPSAIADRFTGHLGHDKAVVTRRNEYHAMVAGVSKQPLFGVGFGRTVQWQTDDGRLQSSSGDLENSYLWILAGGGGLALSAMLLWLLAFFADTFHRRRWADRYGRALLFFSMALVFIFAVNALTGPTFSDSTFALGLWAAALLPSTVRPPADDQPSQTSLRA